MKKYEGNIRKYEEFSEIQAFRNSGIQNQFCSKMLIHNFLILSYFFMLKPRRNFLDKPKNKDHVSCFSIWEGRDRNFSYSQSLYRESFKFFQVQEAMLGGGLRIFPSSKAYIGGENVYHYELTCSVLTARVWGGREVWGLYGGNRGMTARNRL